MKVISSIDDAVGLVGQELGVGEWHEIDQKRINEFADVTGTTSGSTSTSSGRKPKALTAQRLRTDS